MDVLEKKVLSIVKTIIEQASESESYSYEREIKMNVAHELITALLEDEDGDKVD